VNYCGDLLLLAATKLGGLVLPECNSLASPKLYSTVLMPPFNRDEQREMA
jgi:hypothetical protein